MLLIVSAWACWRMYDQRDFSGTMKAPAARYSSASARMRARAFASLADFVRLTRGQLADGGVWLAMKGKRPDDEMAALPDDVDVFHVEQLQVPGLNAERCLVWMRLRP